jgi:hypothetical protein
MLLIQKYIFLECDDMRIGDFFSPAVRMGTTRRTPILRYPALQERFKAPY